MTSSGLRACGFLAVCQRRLKTKHRYLNTVSQEAGIFVKGFWCRMRHYSSGMLTSGAMSRDRGAEKQPLCLTTLEPQTRQVEIARLKCWKAKTSNEIVTLFQARLWASGRGECGRQRRLMGDSLMLRLWPLVPPKEPTDRVGNNQARAIHNAITC